MAFDDLGPVGHPSGHTPPADDDLKDPYQVAALFLEWLDDPESAEELAALVETPEAWGDFSALRAVWQQFDRPAPVQPAFPAEGAPHVAHVAILTGVDRALEFDEDSRVLVDAWVNMLWNTEQGRWVVYSITDRKIDPALMPDA